MKILMLTDAWKPIWGGGQEHIYQVSKILRGKYHYKVDILAPNIIWPWFNFHNFFHRILFTLYSIFKILNSNYDLYHSHSPSTSIFLPLVKLRGNKTAITRHGTGIDTVGGGLLNSTKLFKLLNLLIFDVWPYDYKFSATNYKNYVVVGNGVNVKDFDRQKEVPHKKFRIFWIGRRYDPIKGVKYLESATKGLKNIELDLAENVYGDEKIKRFKMADLFVLPSISEGLPLVLLEAMAAKLPIITTDVGDCGELVKKSKSGLVIPPKNVTALKSAIIKMYKSKKLKQMGENGYKFVKQQYSWDSVVPKYIQFYPLF